MSTLTRTTTTMMMMTMMKKKVDDDEDCNDNDDDGDNEDDNEDDDDDDANAAYDDSDFDDDDNVDDDNDDDDGDDTDGGECLSHRETSDQLALQDFPDPRDPQAKPDPPEPVVPRVLTDVLAATDLLETLVQQDNPVWQEREASQVCPVWRERGELQELLDHPDPLDRKEKLDPPVPLACPEDQGSQDPLAKMARAELKVNVAHLVAQDFKETLDPQAPPEHEELQEHQDQTVRPVSVVLRVPKDELAPLAALELPDQEENEDPLVLADPLALLETLVLQARLVLLVTLANLDSKVCLAPQAPQVRTASPVRLDPLVPQERLELLVNEESKVSLERSVNPVSEVPPEREALVDQWEKSDNLDLPDPPALVVILAQLEILVLEVREVFLAEPDHVALLVPKVSLAVTVSQDLLVSKVCLDLPVSPDLLDWCLLRETEAHPVCQVRLDPPVVLADPDPQALLDLKATLVLLEHPVSLDLPERLDQLAHGATLDHVVILVNKDLLENLAPRVQMAPRETQVRLVPLVLPVNPVSLVLWAHPVCPAHQAHPATLDQQACKASAAHPERPDPRVSLARLEDLAHLDVMVHLVIADNPDNLDPQDPPASPDPRESEDPTDSLVLLERLDPLVLSATLESLVREVRMDRMDPRDLPDPPGLWDHLATLERPAQLVREARTATQVFPDALAAKDHVVIPDLQDNLDSKAHRVLPEILDPLDRPASGEREALPDLLATKDDAVKPERRVDLARQDSPASADLLDPQVAADSVVLPDALVNPEHKDVLAVPVHVDLLEMTDPQDLQDPPVHPDPQDLPAMLQSTLAPKATANRRDPTHTWTCRDIKEKNPDFKSGEYWIDPNLGSAVDAILVYCRMETGETCIRPKPSVFDKKRWTKDTRSGQYFMGDIHGNKEFFYKVDSSNQLSHLQMNSEGATQRLTYHCLNSQGYGNRLAVYSGDELDTAEGRFKKSTFIDVQDDCVADNQWHSAIYDVRTNLTRTLPITDVLVFDVGRENQQFGIELGEACFS
nr:hypothetical protein BaRGS_009956 [Batillaria attramentaria]